MDMVEPNTHSFVVKIWLEEMATEQQPAQWRGHITHVHSGERRYFQSFGDMSAFIDDYLSKMGVQPFRPTTFSWRNKLHHWYANFRKTRRQEDKMTGIQ